RRRHTRSKRDWSSDVCSSDLIPEPTEEGQQARPPCVPQERAEKLQARAGRAAQRADGKRRNHAAQAGRHPGHESKRAQGRGEERDRKSGVEGKRVEKGGRRER